MRKRGQDTPPADKLRAAVIRQLGGMETFKEVVRHPTADSGWLGFTYYTDTVAFYERHREAIFALLDEDAESQGVSIPALIASFGGADAVTDYDTFANLLAWYTLEAVANREEE